MSNFTHEAYYLVKARMAKKDLSSRVVDHLVVSQPVPNVLFDSVQEVEPRDPEVLKRWAAQLKVNGYEALPCGPCGRRPTAGITVHKLWKALRAMVAVPQGDQVEFALACLKNMGHDTDCGACMEIAFTGTTTTSHSCSDHDEKL